MVSPAAHGKPATQEDVSQPLPLFRSNHPDRASDIIRDRPVSKRNVGRKIMSKGEATRQRIIAQAAPLLNQRGYEGCSLQDIMSATGLEKGGIYRHFDSKGELAAEAFDFAWATIVSKRFDKLDSIPNHVDRLKQHILNFTVRSGLPGGCPLLNTAVDSYNGNPVLRERVRKSSPRLANQPQKNPARRHRSRHHPTRH